MLYFAGLKLVSILTHFLFTVSSKQTYLLCCLQESVRISIK